MAGDPARWRILEAPPDDRWEWAIQALSDIQREVELETWGWTDAWAPPPYWRADLADRDYTEHLLYVAVPAEVEPGRAEQVAGAAVVHLPLTSNQHMAWLYLIVRAEQRRAGAGTALLRHVEREMVSRSRRVLTASAGVSPEPPPGPGVIEAPTGAGRVPKNIPATVFAHRNGFTLYQVARYLVLQVPEDLSAVVAQREVALAHAEPAYRLHTWPDEVPPEWLAQLGALESRMVTEAPSGTLSYEADPWDEQRCARWVRSFGERGMHVSITAAEHVGTSTLVGHTVLMYPIVEVPFAFQESTLVVPAHRGHRLGLAMKTTNLLAVRQRRPGLLRVHTGNANENAPMLAINTALGFAPAGVLAMWQKNL